MTANADPPAPPIPDVRAHVDTPVARLTALEVALADANRQLLERDEEFARLLAERDAALERIQARAQAQVDALAHELEARAAKVEELDARLRSAYETIAAMEATRVWRLGQRLWATRDSLARALRFRRA